MRGKTALAVLTFSACQLLGALSASAQTIQTVAGGRLYANSPALQVSVNSPSAVAYAPNGSIYVVEANWVDQFNPSTGLITAVAGNGFGNYSGDGGPATRAGLGQPFSAAVDGAGNLYIADINDNVVRKVSAATGVISTVAGTGNRGYSGDGGPASSAELNQPYGVAVDGAGNLYIADEGNSVIREVSAASGVISTVAGNGSGGYSGDGGPATNAAIGQPFGVAVDGAGNLYITDNGNSVIRKVSAATGVISTVAGNGSHGYSGDGGPATSAELAGPYVTVVDGAGNLYIADNGNERIRTVIAQTGVISTVAGNGTQGYSGDGGPAMSAELHNPQGVAVDGLGNLYIGDTDNEVIRKVSVATGVISTVAGNGSYGYSGDGGPATSAELAGPSGVAVTSGGNLYIADTNNSLVREVTGLVVSSPPVVTPVVSGTLGNNGWYTSNVQVSWTVSGGPSPITSETGCGAVTISTDTSGQTLTCSATSASGGTTTQSVTIKRDATPPTISLTAPTNGATYIIGSTLAAAYTCADALSGSATCVGTVATGTPVSTAATGSHTFTVSAADQAGNVAQVLIGYSVALASQTITFGALASQPAGTTLALQASASSGLPVTFMSSTNTVCTVSGSTATLLTTGTCTITASQPGNASYSAATSVSQSFTVTPKLTSDTVTLGIAGGNQTYPTWTNFAIGPSHKGSPVPTGTVTLYDNSTALVTLPLGSNGVAYYTANPLNVGANVMTASYSGDSHYAAAVSAPVTLNVAPAPVHLTASCWGGTPYKVAYQCTVNVSAGTAAAPTGSISYSLDGAPGTSVALVNGNAAFTDATVPASGAHKLTIAYAGQGNYAAATTLTECFTTAPGQTQLHISSSSSYLAAGSSLTLTVTASTPKSGVPPGSVTVYDNGAALGTAPIGSNGIATYPVASVSKGTHTYTAKYTATSNYAAATSGNASVTAH